MYPGKFIKPAMWFLLTSLLFVGNSYGQTQTDSIADNTHFISDFKNGFKDTFTLKGYHFRVTAVIENEYESYTFIM